METGTNHLTRRCWVFFGVQVPAIVRQLVEPTYRTVEAHI